MPSLTRRRWLRAALSLGAASAAAQGMQRRALVFPRDFGAHPDTRTEWWYVTGTLAAGTELRGFQITFFRSRTAVPAAHPSRFAARQLLFAHAAVSDLPQRRLRHDQRLARAGFGIAEAAEHDTAISLQGWRLKREGGSGLSRYRAIAASETARFAFDLGFAARQPVLLQGDGGWSRKGPREEQASHYYSEAQLAVSGTLQLDGRALQVQGRAWLDHEWSEMLMDPQAVGWDWIGMNLDDGSALMAFRLRRADGTALWAGGTFRSAAGERRSFSADAVAMEPGRTWTSPGSRAAYPVEWRVVTPAGRFAVRALMDNQELDSRAGTGSIYWEGLSELLDERGHRVGLGYLEMTGYAGVLRL